MAATADLILLSAAAARPDPTRHSDPLTRCHSGCRLFPVVEGRRRRSPHGMHRVHPIPRRRSIRRANPSPSRPTVGIGIAACRPRLCTPIPYPNPDRRRPRHSPAERAFRRKFAAIAPAQAAFIQMDWRRWAPLPFCGRSRPRQRCGTAKRSPRDATSEVTVMLMQALSIKTVVQATLQVRNI